MIARIGLTIGEPAGVGPELVVRTAAKRWPARLIAYGDPALIADTADRLGVKLKLAPDDGERATRHGVLFHEATPSSLNAAVRPGTLDPRNAAATLAMLNRAAMDAKRRHIDALVTAPVQKSVLDSPSAPFSGHTEFFQALAGAERVVMLLTAAPKKLPLRVALATTHLPLRAVANAITPDLLHSTLNVLHAGLKRDYGISAPRIAVLGLNPHAGESGHLGTEEQRIIAPVLKALRGKGLELEGPLPADTAFSAERIARTDAFLAMYHDQGLPVLKYAGFGSAVNVTLGLPYVRTSVDHGTALDIAGQGVADPGSLFAAIDEAIRMSAARSP